MESQSSFNSHSLMAEDSEYFSKYFLAVLYFLFQNIPLSSLAHLLSGWFSFVFV